MTLVRTFIVAAMVLVASVAHAQITVPHTFVPQTRILSAEVNDNFTELGDKALNRLDGTMLGELITQDLFPDGNNTRALGSITNRWSVVNGVLGNFSGAVTGASFTGSGADLTSIPETAIVDGTLLARVGGAEAITGAWTFNANFPQRFVGDNGSSLAIRLVGRTSDNLVSIDFVDNTQTVGVGSISVTPGNGLTYHAINNGHSFSGRINTSASQPGFLAYNSVTDADQANNSLVDVDTEVYDNSNNFASDTFTAPVAGTYHLCAAMGASGASGDTIGLVLSTSVGSYGLGFMSLGSELFGSVNGCVLLAMGASNTATLILQTSATVAVTGPVSGVRYTYFSGRLVP